MSEIKPEPMEFVKKANALRAKGANNEQWEFATLLGEACDIIDGLTAEIKVKDERTKKFEEAFTKIRDAETECCSRCEGNGRLYADGKAHYMSENVPTISCPNCLGEGRIPAFDAKEIAEQALKGGEI